ncbi:hypothetical protein [Peribacillus simplex]|uniref:Uncharacterized protein n=1 Tax=Peribacillus simplex TaxID=1478 RepID=A0AAN2TRS8_9BACI|nr:hypothetical protein [Peribacillus simplex]CEG31420.1 hypothetical protein BN1180_01564 [Peribacillus simplex]
MNVICIRTYEVEKQYKQYYKGATCGITGKKYHYSKNLLVDKSLQTADDNIGLKLLTIKIK